MKYKTIPPSLELSSIMHARKYGREPKYFYYDGDFAWLTVPGFKKRRIKIVVKEGSDNGNTNNNAIRSGVA